MNLTVQYTESHEHNGGFDYAGDEAPSVIAMANLWWNGVHHPAYINCYLRDKTESRFLHCMRGKEREGFSFLFWAVNFDGSGWILLAISFLGLTLVLPGQSARRFWSSLRSSVLPIL
jgi:hypothetical protein